MDIEKALKEMIADDSAAIVSVDFAKAVLHELAELRAYKDAAEKQEPVQWVCELASNPWPNGGGTRRDTKEEALKYINGDSNHCKYDTVSPIYRLPVEADKQVLADNAKITDICIAVREMAEAFKNEWPLHIGKYDWMIGYSERLESLNKKTMK